MPGRASKILGILTVGADIGTCKISAKSDNLVTSWAKQQGSGQRHRAALYYGIQHTVIPIIGGLSARSVNYVVQPVSKI